MVSINGVIQKPNTGTSAPSEGFAMVDSNTIVFGGNLPTGAEVFVIQIGSAISLQVPADNTVATAKLQNGAVTTAKIVDDAVTTHKIADNAVTGAKIADNLDIPDNNTIRLGSGNDLSLFHNGTNSHIHSATGELDIRSDDFHLRNAANNENMIVADANGAVELYHDNVKKFETSVGGGTLTGDLTVSGNIYGGNHITIQDSDGASDMLKIGADEDIRIYHYNNNSYIRQHTDKPLIIGGTSSGQSLYLSPKDGEYAAVFKPNAEVELYHNNVKKLNTKSEGVHISGSLDIHGHVYPFPNNTYDLGTINYSWRNIYTSDLNLSNEGSSNDVDGTWGSYTIQEGVDDLFLINRRNGKKYKFNLTEVS